MPSPPHETDDEPNTPPDTSSALLKLGLARCPCCEGTGELAYILLSGGYEDKPCSYCKGGKKVSIKEAADWKSPLGEEKK